eukprot:2101502-Pleurochrysis_carterae.AAC.1
MRVHACGCVCTRVAACLRRADKCLSERMGVLLGRCMGGHHPERPGAEAHKNLTFSGYAHEAARAVIVGAAALLLHRTRARVCIRTRARYTMPRPARASPVC